MEEQSTRFIYTTYQGNHSDTILLRNEGHVKQLATPPSNFGPNNALGANKTDTNI